MAKVKTIIFIHQNFPAQFKHLAPLLAKNNNYNVHSISLIDESSEGVIHHKYSLEQTTSETVHPLAQEFEAKIIRASSLSKLAYIMKSEGIMADLIIGHPGWGETLFIKNVWPDSKLLSYMEFFYYSKNSDVDFDSEFPNDESFLSNKLTARNAPILSDLYNADKIITPTNFQASHAPEYFKKKLVVLHEGIATNRLQRNDNLRIQINEHVLTSNDKIVLFVARNLEPYRGYHSFIRSIPDVLKKHPDSYISIVGGHDVSYGKKPPKGESFKEIFQNEVRESISDKKLRDLFDKRVLFLGYLEYESLVKMIQISTLHVYLTYPFVLSWSFLESMSCESIIIASDTEPVREVINDKKNGLLVDFFNYEEISKNIINILDDREKFKHLGKNARDFIIKNYDLEKVILPKYLKLIKDLLDEK